MHITLRTLLSLSLILYALIAPLASVKAQGLLPNAEQTFVDENGAPLAGGFVYMYVPGTTTPKSTWQDSALTTPNTNPITLDSAGRARIWGAGSYRQIVTKSTGDTVWDQVTQLDGNVPAVNSLTALKAWPAQQGPVIRLGYSTPGDGGYAFYNWSSSACSIGAGAGDNGLQVKPNSGTGCWIADFSGVKADVRVWGATLTGVAHDDGAAINNCITNFGNCYIPPSQAGAYTTVTLENTGRIYGDVFMPANPSTASPPNVTAFAGSSFILCSATVSPCVENGGSAGLLTTAAPLSNLIVSRVTGTPGSGIIGIKWNGGFNIPADNVLAFNHDICLDFYATATTGIASNANNLSAAACKSHFWKFDGWPELRVTGGRTGFNGFADYAGAAGSDFVLMTNSNCATGGCGPNTIFFVNHQFNPGTQGPECAFRWASFTAAPASNTKGSELHLVNDHIEWHDNGAGVFCSDNTVPIISSLVVDDNVISVTPNSGPAFPLFVLNTLTALEQSWFSNTLFAGCSDITLAPTPVSGPAFSDVHWSHNFGCGNTSFTSNSVGDNRLFSDNNTWVGLTIAGAWNNLSIQGDNYSSLTDTASGNVSMGTAQVQNWTPVLKIGGSSVGITQANTGSAKRTPSGGFIVDFSVNLSAIPATAGTAVTITGVPYTCVAGDYTAAGGGALSNALNLTGLTSPVNVTPNTLTPGELDLFTWGAAGLLTMLDSNLTATTSIQGTITCSHTL